MPDKYKYESLVRALIATTRVLENLHLLTLFERAQEAEMLRAAVDYVGLDIQLIKRTVEELTNMPWEHASSQELMQRRRDESYH